jgi:hypothetical protein
VPTGYPKTRPDSLTELEKALAKAEWILMGKKDSSEMLTTGEVTLIHRMADSIKGLPYTPSIYAKNG